MKYSVPNKNGCPSHPMQNAQIHDWFFHALEASQKTPLASAALYFSIARNRPKTKSK